MVPLHFPKYTIDKTLYRRLNTPEFIYKAKM